MDKPKDTFQRAFRFLCHLNLQDHSIEEQKEHLQLIAEMKSAARSVSIDNDKLADIARGNKESSHEEKTNRHFYEAVWSIGGCAICGDVKIEVGKRSNQLGHVDCSTPLSFADYQWYMDKANKIAGAKTEPVDSRKDIFVGDATRLNRAIRMWGDFKDSNLRICLVCLGVRHASSHPKYAHSACWCGLTEADKNLVNYQMTSRGF